MIRTLNELFGHEVRIGDESVARVHDFLFDDRDWVIRYLVLDTGSWLPGRKVLVSPLSIREVDWTGGRVTLDLTKRKIELSPEIDAAAPVHRRMEKRLAEHFHWPMYWGYPPGVMAPEPDGTIPIMPSDEREPSEDDENTEANLRSAKEVTGYHIRATDDEIGHVEAFIGDDEEWVIRYLVVDTRNVLPGRKVIISPDWIHDVRWDDRKVTLSVVRAKVEESPRYDPSEPIDRKFEERLDDYYGRGAPVDRTR